MIIICNSQNIRRYSTMQIGRDSLFKPPRLRNEQRIFMPEIRFKLMQNSRLNSDPIIYLVILIIHLYNLCKLNGLIINFEIGVFDDVRLEVCIRPLQCYVACSDCDGRKSRTMYFSNLASKCFAVLPRQCLACKHHFF